MRMDFSSFDNANEENTYLDVGDIEDRSSLVQTPCMTQIKHFQNAENKRELRTAQLKKKIDKMLTLHIVQESVAEENR